MPGQIYTVLAFARTACVTDGQKQVHPYFRHVAYVTVAHVSKMTGKTHFRSHHCAVDLRLRPVVQRLDNAFEIKDALELRLQILNGLLHFFHFGIL